MVFHFRDPIWRLWICGGGGEGPWFPSLGHRNLVEVFKKRIELVEVIWENGDFRFGGS